MKREKDKADFLTTMALTIPHTSKEIIFPAYSGSYNHTKTTSATTISSFAEPDHSLNCHQELRLSHRTLSTSRSPSELRRKASIAVPISHSHKGTGSQRTEGRYLEEKGQEQ